MLTLIGGVIFNFIDIINYIKIESRQHTLSVFGSILKKRDHTKSWLNKILSSLPVIKFHPSHSKNSSQFVLQFSLWQHSQSSLDDHLGVSTSGQRGFFLHHRHAPKVKRRRGVLHLTQITAWVSTSSYTSMNRPTSFNFPRIPHPRPISRESALAFERVIASHTPSSL